MPPGFGPVAPRPLDAWGNLGGRLPCVLRGRPRLQLPRPHRGFLSLGDHLVERVWLALAWGSPSSLGQLAVRQSVPNSVHTRRLPAPAGSSSRAGQEVWPPPTSLHTRCLLRPAGGPRVEVLTLEQLLRPILSSPLQMHTPAHTGLPSGEPQRPAPSPLPFRALGSTKSETRSVQSSHDVTAFTLRRRSVGAAAGKGGMAGLGGWRVAFSGAEDLG